MTVRARSVVAEADRAWLFAQSLDQLRQTREFAVRLHEQDRRIVDHAGDQSKIARFVLRLLRHRYEQVAWNVDDTDGVAIRRRASEIAQRNFSGGSGLVDDDKRDFFAEPFLHGERQLARHDIGSAARSKANDDFDR